MLMWRGEAHKASDIFLIWCYSAPASILFYIYDCFAYVYAYEPRACLVPMEDIREYQEFQMVVIYHIDPGNQT